MITEVIRFPEVPTAARTGAEFWQVWMRHRDQLLRQCLGIMSGNRADAEDALSAAMIRASGCCEAYANQIVSDRAWLSRLVANSCIDHIRAAQRHRRLLENSVLATTGQPASAPLSAWPAGAAPSPSPEQEVIDRSLLSCLAEDMRRLPDHLRRPLMMRFLQGKSYAEIAETLNLTNAAVRKRIQLARQRLRQTRV